MPLHSTGSSKLRAFVYGVLSGIVEPIAGILTILAIGIIEPVMPYLLSFAAGAMIYVVIEELVPEMSEGGHSNRATIAFMVGFCLMMTLDVMLGYTRANPRKEQENPSDPAATAEGKA